MNCLPSDPGRRNSGRIPPRPYHKCVLVGNWYEDRALEEDIVKDYLYKRENNALAWQKMSGITKICLGPAPLTRSGDQCLRYGSRVMILNHQRQNTCDKVMSLCLYVPDDAIHVNEFTDAIINQSPKNLSASSVVMSPTAISTFVIRGLHSAQDGTPVRYGETFYIYTSDEKLLMMSLKRNPMFKWPVKSGNNWTALVSECSWSCAWKAIPFDPRERLELEGEPVMCLRRVLINNIESNENLRVEEEVEVRTPFGLDKEVTCKTRRDSSRVEESSNHWVFYMDCQGREKYPIKEMPTQN